MHWALKRQIMVIRYNFGCPDILSPLLPSILILFYSITVSDLWVVLSGCLTSSFLPTSALLLAHKGVKMDEWWIIVHFVSVIVVCVFLPLLCCYLLKAWLSDSCHSHIENSSLWVLQKKNLDGVRFWAAFTFLVYVKMERIAGVRSSESVEIMNGKCYLGIFEDLMMLIIGNMHLPVFPFLSNQNGEMKEWGCMNLVTLQKRALVMCGLLKKIRPLSWWAKTAVLKGIVI